MAVRKVKLEGYRVTKDGRVVKIHKPRDASHAAAMRHSTRQRPVRRLKSHFLDTLNARA